MSTEVPEMYRNNPTLKELSKLPAHVLAQELIHMAERAENSSTKNFLHYKFMPDNAALELGAYTLLSQGFRLNDKQRVHLASFCEADEDYVGEDDCLIIFDDDEDDDEDEGVDGVIPRLMPALTFSPELSHNLEGDGPLHRLVVGDNYHALAGLQASLATNPDGVYDLIYIDPPYNTGKGFTYNDNNVDPDDPWRSTKWASMMEPRLRLAHNLLKDTGVIFLSIDDNELHSLKLLCDSVFGRRNFIANVVVQNNPGGRQLDEFYATSHEYALVYAKIKSKTTVDTSTTLTVRDKDFPEKDEDGNRYRYVPLRNSNHKFNPKTRPNLAYPLYGDTNTGEVSVENFEGAETVTPVFGDGELAVWRWSTSKVSVQRDELTLRKVRGRNGTRWDIFQKDYKGTDRTKKINSVWGTDVAGTSNGGVDDLKVILGSGVFDGPKPIQLLKFIIGQAPKDAKILDFFGGSGSTAEAVLALNAEDGGTREVTIVTNDENNIGTTITRERIVRVMTGEKWADGKSREGYGGRLGVWRVGVTPAVDFSSTYDEGLHHSWNGEAGKWGAWQNTPLLHRADNYYDVYTDGDGAYSLVFHNIDHLRGLLVDEALGEFPDAQVFLPYQHVYKTSRGFYVDDVPDAIPLPLGVVSPIQNGVADSILTPYIKRGGGSYLDRIAALTGLSDDDRES